MTSGKRMRGVARRLRHVATVGVLLGGALFGTAAAVYATDGTTDTDPLPAVSPLPSPTLTEPSLTDPTGLLAPAPSPTPSAEPSSSTSPTPSPTTSTDPAPQPTVGTDLNTGLGTGDQVTSSTTVTTGGKVLGSDRSVALPGLPGSHEAGTEPKLAPHSLDAPQPTTSAIDYSGLPASTVHLLRLTNPLLEAVPAPALGATAVTPPLVAGVPLDAATVLQPVTPSAAHRPAGLDDPVFGAGLLTLIAAGVVAAGTRWRTRRLRRTTP